MDVADLAGCDHPARFLDRVFVALLVDYAKFDAVLAAGLDRGLAKPGTGGKICVYTYATIDLLADVSGYFPAGSGFTPITNPTRILDTALALFNEGGAAHVTTNHIADELEISPGNLYYHFPAKDQLVSHLFDNYKTDILKLLDASQDVKDVEDAWFFLHSLFELIWEHRFLYRDLNDLLSKNRHLETNFKHILEVKTSSLQQLLQALANQRLSFGEKEVQ